ncbi:trypsin-like [Microplitis mediator]|uniref:trypsin-like n=1 Tax=Microplitis mediator TaxID=375433 RepID=UPI0025566257|nr:trypsin-like [Microplitis mediator]
MFKSVIIFVFLIISTVVIPTSSTCTQYTDRLYDTHQPSNSNNNNLAPYLVSIRLNDVHICSGAIITPEDILTSGQCVYPIVDSKTHELVSIHLGSTNRYKNGSIYYISSIKVKESFSAKRGQVPIFDIATIRLSERIIFHETRNQACIGERNTEKSTIINQQAVVAEWIDNKFETLNNLQLTNWTIISDEECDNYYSFMGKVTNDAKICAVNMDRDGDVNMCPGDLGNPLIVDGKLVGYKMWRMGCNFPEAPVIFRLILHTYYYDWMKNNIHGNLC